MHDFSQIEICMTYISKILVASFPNPPPTTCPTARLSLRQHLATRLGLRSQEGLKIPWAAWAMPRMPRSTGSTGGGYCWLLDAVGSINCHEKLRWFRCLYEGLHQRRFDWEITGGFGFWLAGLMGVYFEFCFWREELCVREPCQVWATPLACR
jgi:hypothetical protein